MRMRSRLFVAVMISSACAEPAPAAKTTAPSAPSAPTQSSEPAPIADASAPEPGESRTFRGTLEFDELGPGKSVDAYLGQEFVLVSADGRHTLRETETVTRDQLAALAGKDIEVTATFVPATEPDPNEQAPMDGDVLMKRPEYWQVTAARVLPQ